MLSDTLDQWSFTDKDAARITQPVLNLRGAHTVSHMREVHDTVRTWLPQAENDVLPDATHAMTQTNPKGAAELLVRFLSKHKL